VGIKYHMDMGIIISRDQSLAFSTVLAIGHIFEYQ
jgi:hypothetical protein